MGVEDDDILVRREPYPEVAGVVDDQVVEDRLDLWNPIDSLKGYADLKRVRAMMTGRYQLAQANIGRILAPLDDPRMKGFVDQLEYINAVADRGEGFVWRLQTEEGDATAVRAFDDDRILFNMSVWESFEALYEYTYRSDHRGPLRDRRQWFERLERPHLVLWWVPAGHTPTVEEAKQRLDLLRDRGPSPEAFTFQQPYSPAGTPLIRPRREDSASCGT